MEKYLLPDSKKIKGPWLLTEANLNELSKIIEDIWIRLSNNYELEIEKELKYRMPIQQKTPEKIREEIKERYPYNSYKKDVLISFKSSKKKKYNSLEDVIKDYDLNDQLVTEIEIDYQIGSGNFRFEVSKSNPYELPVIR
ncbi:MAG TPA: hypothetical protein GX707_04405 [Epulopiscium sp.]|nr:hypothetical protein [Candidatus Epulonipiscium sp.]